MLKLLIVVLLSTLAFGFYVWQTKRNAHIAVWGAMAVAVLLFVLPLLFLVSNIPFLDDYGGIIEYLAHSPGWRFEHLLDFWNEHRIAFPRLVFQFAGWAFGTNCLAGCLVLGNLIYMLFVVLLLVISRDRLLFVPFAWLFLDLVHFENTTWAFASVQNHSVLLWALLSCCFFAHGWGWRCLIGALVCATLCTFSSAPGVAIWGALCAMGIKRSLCNSNGRIRFSFSSTWVRIFVFVLVMMVNCAIFFDGYFAAASAHAAALRKLATPSSCPFWDALDYCISFGGAILPIHGVAIVLGVLVTAGSFYVMLNVKRIKNDAFLGLMLFGWSMALGGAISRSESTHTAALACRYESASILLCLSVVFLVNELVENTRAKALFVMAFTYSAFFINFAVLGFGFPRRLEWKHRVEQSMVRWPDGDFDLSLTSDDSLEADRILRLGIARGVYDF